MAHLGFIWRKPANQNLTICEVLGNSKDDLRDEGGTRGPFLRWIDGANPIEFGGRKKTRTSGTACTLGFVPEIVP